MGRYIATADEDLIEDLPVELSPEERRVFGEELCAQLSKLEEHDGWLAECKAEHKIRVTDTTRRVTHLRDCVTSGIERRPVLCVEQPDYDKGVVAIVRTDTNAVVRTRPMTHTERQMELPVSFAGADMANGEEHDVHAAEWDADAAESEADGGN